MRGRFGELLRQRRMRAGLTQDELAERAGVSARTIRSLETGQQRDPRVTTARELAEALSRTPDEREELLAALIGSSHKHNGTGTTVVVPAVGVCASCGQWSWWVMRAPVAARCPQLLPAILGEPLIRECCSRVIKRDGR